MVPPEPVAIATPTGRAALIAALRDAVRDGMAGGDSALVRVAVEALAGLAAAPPTHERSVP